VFLEILSNYLQPPLYLQPIPALPATNPCFTCNQSLLYLQPIPALPATNPCFTCNQPLLYLQPIPALPATPAVPATPALPATNPCFIYYTSVLSIPLLGLYISPMRPY